MTAEAIDLSVRIWTYEPERARDEATVTAFSHGSEAILSAGSFSWRADLPAGLGGTNASPSPVHLLLGALAGSAVVLIRDTIAPQLGIAVDAVEAVASCENDHRGFLGMDGLRPELKKLHLDVQIRSPGGEAAAQQLTAAWRERCPVYAAILNPTNVSINVSSS